VSAESVALIPAVRRVREIWLPAEGERWEAYLTDDELPEVEFFCPTCAEREFHAD
jgi:hypothetical protein